MIHKNRILSNILFLAIIGLISLAIFYIIPEPTAGSYVDQLDEITKESVDLLKEMNKYLTTIAFVIIGVLGNVLIGELKLNHRDDYFTMALFFISIIFSLISIYYGYLVYSEIFKIVSYHILNIHDPQIKHSVSGQFITLFISAFFFIWYIFNSYLRQKKEQNAIYG